MKKYYIITAIALVGLLFVTACGEEASQTEVCRLLKDLTLPAIPHIVTG